MDLTSKDLLYLEQRVSDLLKLFGNTLSHEWQYTQRVSLKENREPVTELEKDIRFELAKLLPSAGFIVEEGEDTTPKEFTWVLDPIDQTKNFIGQIPLYLHTGSISL